MGYWPLRHDCIQVFSIVSDVFWLTRAKMENPMYTSQFQFFPTLSIRNMQKQHHFPPKDIFRKSIAENTTIFSCTRGCLLKDWIIIDYKVTSPHEVWQAVALTQLRIEMVLRQSLFLGSWKNNLWKSSDGCPPKKKKRVVSFGLFKR